MLRRYCIALLLGLSLAVANSSVLAEPLSGSGFAQEGEDAPAILVPAHPRDEAELDRVQASALFAHGRLLFQREDFDGALRRYERAYRNDPDAVLILDEIVPLAFELGHNNEAARYAVIAAERNPKDALLLRRLAMHLTDEQQYDRALKLYEKSFELQKDADDVTAILLHLEIGRLHFLAGNFQPAAAAFARVRDAIVDPKKYNLSEELQKIILGNAHGTYTLLGESFLQAEKYDDAEAMFRKANELKADEPRLAYLLARIRFAQKRYDDTLKELDQYFQAKATSAAVEPYDLWAETLAAQLGDEAKAKTQTLDKLKTLAAADGDNQALAFAYGRALRQADKLDEALIVLRKSFDKEVTSEVAEELAIIYHRQGQVAELLDVLGKSIGKTGSLAAIGDEGPEIVKDTPLMQKLIATARDKKQAGADKLPPGEALAIATLAMQAKDFDAGDEFYAIVVEQSPASKTKSPRAEAILAWGLELFQADENARAEKVFRQALDKKLIPERDELLQYFLAGALEMQGKTDEALAVLDQALAKNKSSIRLLGRQAWIQYHAKRYAESEKNYLALIAKHDKDHKSDETREALREARLVLSNLCAQNDRRADAIEWLEQVLDEYPEDVGALNDLGYLWAERGERPQRALAMTKAAVAAEPDNQAYRDSLGWAYYQVGQYNEAIVELEKAASLKDPDGVILDHLGDAYAQAKQLDKAQASYEKAVLAFEKEKELDKAQATKTKLAGLQK